MDTKGIKEEILEHVDPVEFFKEEYPEWSGSNNDLVHCPKIDRHEDESPSLSINPETGEFLCQGCGWRGTSVIGYATEIHYKGKFKYALRELYSKYVRKSLPTKEIKRYITNLNDRPKIQSRITQIRGWTRTTQNLFRLGWDPKRRRVVIPIFNRPGICVDLRFHDTINLAKKVRRKRIPILAPKGARTGDWFPLSPKLNPFSEDHQVIWLLEGEPDVILATQDGLNCITVTGGVGAWRSLPHSSLMALMNKDVIICFDDDKAGRRSSEALVDRLAGVEVKSLKNITVPQGNDISEYFLRHGGSVAQLKLHASGSKFVFQPRKKSTHIIPLSESSHPKYIGQTIITEVLVNGKGKVPIQIPRRIKFSCHTSDPCRFCPCIETGYSEHHILKDDPGILDWVFERDPEKQLKSERNLPNNCPIGMEVLEWQSLERTEMIPALSIRESKNMYVSRTGFYLGHGLESNRTYRISATPTVHPKSKESVLLFPKAMGTHDAIQGFKLSKREVEELRGLVGNVKPSKVLRGIAESISRNHTRIYGRSALHVAVDITFHSPREFDFADTPIPKGSIETVLFGDTRCGKGQVAEGFVRLYDLGCVVSGENASFMGLVGGAQKADRGFDLVWGRIPTNHGRLVVVDEFSGFRDLGRMSRIRSEGIAELDKGGINASTGANTRLIWIANPRGGKDLSSFSTGVEGLMDLVGASEDVARFDLAFAVAKGEVPIEEINRLDHTPIQTPYHPDLLRKIVLWVWSREADQVFFDRETTEYILEASNRMAMRYSSTIPLIQGENVRFKLAKIAAGIAGRCFSTPDGNTLVVRREHAMTAESFLDYCYKRPVMGYLTYSQIEKAGKDLIGADKLKQLFLYFPKETRDIVIEGMLSMSEFGIREMQDWCGTDNVIARKHISTLVRCHAVKKVHGSPGYTKKPAFIKFLKKLRRS